MILQSFALEVYKHETCLSHCVLESKKNLGRDPILKWEIVKKFRKYKSVDKYFN